MQISVKGRFSVVIGLLALLGTSSIKAADGRSMAYSNGRTISYATGGEPYLGNARLRRSGPNAYARPSAETTRQMLDCLYADINGSRLLSEQDSKAIVAAGGAPTYGEITYDALQTLIKDMRLKERDVVYDLGSGVGKFCVQVYFNTPVKKVVGIELGAGRCGGAHSVRKTLKNQNMLDKDRKLKFENKDILKAHMKDATVVYMCSTCFSNELMQAIMEKVSGLKDGLRVITLKTLPAGHEAYGFALTNEYRLPMTWSKESPVYVYTLKK